MVQAIVPAKGDHGAYAVVNCPGFSDSVTFSLDPPVWLEKDPPKQGQSVFLAKVREHDRGWRAHVARFWKLSDQQQQQPRNRHSRKKKR
jgi:hypothetical protein